MVLILWGLNAVLLAGGWWLTTEWKPPRGEYPTRPINLVVPFGPGGGSDVNARIFKTAIDDHQLLPEPLVIHNRDGAGATIGSRYVRDAAPDGYTVLFLHDAIITAKYSGMVRYGPEAFEPVACTGESGMVIAVADDSPYHTLTELMEAAREQPGVLSFAVNRGALTHVAGLQLEQAVPGSKFLFPQSGGGQARYNDLIGGHVDVSGFSIEEFMLYRHGADADSPHLRGLAYLAKSRDPAAPEVPTAREQGCDIVTINRFYWWVPKGTPQHRIEVLAQALHAALETEDVTRKMDQIHCKRIFRQGEELSKQLAETERQIAQVEFTKPKGVPDMRRIVMIAASVLLGAWAIQSGITTLPWATGLGLIVCLMIGKLVETLDGWSLFVGLAGVGIFLEHLRPLLKKPLAALSCLWTLAYVGCLSLGWGDFRVLTILFVLFLGGMLTHWSRPRLPVLGLIAQTMAFGLHAVFTLLFEVPLPS
jgi:tripartite-type tricarboxylate transporter receptor subunit TctC